MTTIEKEIICPFGVRKRIVYDSKDSNKVVKSYITKGHFAHSIMTFIKWVKNCYNSLRCLTVCGTRISNFERIVFAAEKYIVDNAEEILNKQRPLDNNHLPPANYSTRCIRLFKNEKYCPIYLTDKGNNKNSELPYDGNKIFYSDEILSLDFLKEIFKEFIYRTDKDISDEKVVKDFRRLSKRFDSKSHHNWYKPFYIDKLIWLSSTGNFYPYSVIIKEMTREKFLNFLRMILKLNV